MSHDRAVDDAFWMRRALALARRGLGLTSPNPMVGAVLVRGRTLLGAGWHHRAGLPHAEVEALEDARRRGSRVTGATLYVTLEPCCTHGRTPPCTDAILRAGIRRVVVAATDPNPRHAGRGLVLLREAGVEVEAGVLGERSAELNEVFNHWIVHRTPFVTLKAAMTLDGKIATTTGESKWITGVAARAEGMRLRRFADAILVGVNTILADDPALTFRGAGARGSCLRRIVLDSHARIPPTARVVSDDRAPFTTIVVTGAANPRRVANLRRRVQVWEALADTDGRVDLRWLLSELGREQVTSVLVEGGGEVNGTFLATGNVHRVALFYAPIILGGARALRGVAGPGMPPPELTVGLCGLRWRRLGPDLFLSARIRT